MDKPSIDPQNVSTWIVFSVVLGLVALLFEAWMFHRQTTNMAEMELQIVVLNRKIEDAKKLALGAAAPTAPSAPAQPAEPPAK